MINAKEIKQRAIIASIEKYEHEIDLISDAIKKAADEGKFMIYFGPRFIKDLRKRGVDSYTQCI